jgi:hypothetical protein
METTPGLITSRLDFQECIRLALIEAADRGGREMLMVDEDFNDWPLGEPEVVDSFARWAMPHRRLVVVASQFDDLVRRHPRWVAFRRTYAHVVDCRVHDEADGGNLPALLHVSDVIAVRMSDTVHWRGRLSRDRTDLLRWKEQVDALLQRSSPSFPATTLGL